jgi:glycosyltransferase involved in cell wall biosynthesis
MILALDGQGPRDRLRVGPNTILVTGSGSTEWRKGPDLFIQVAHLLRKRRGFDGIAFVWVGGNETEVRLHECRHDVNQLDLAESVHLLESMPNPFPYFAASDVFVLTSREDPLSARHA